MLFEGIAISTMCALLFGDHVAIFFVFAVCVGVIIEEFEQQRMERVVGARAF